MDELIVEESKEESFILEQLKGKHGDSSELLVY